MEPITQGILFGRICGNPLKFDCRDENGHDKNIIQGNNVMIILTRRVRNDIVHVWKTISFIMDIRISRMIGDWKRMKDYKLMKTKELKEQSLPWQGK